MPKTAGKNLTWQITHQLGAAIVAGEYSGITFPTEAELCDTYGVSRSVLREAVKMLTAKGLLNARPRQGTWVQPESEWNLIDPDVLGWLLERQFSLSLIKEFTEARLAFEPQAAFLAAEVGSADAIAAIEAGLARMKAAEQGDDDPLQSDIAFHVAILHASGNRFFMQLEELVASALSYSIRLTNKFKGVELASIEAHSAVFDAIRSGEAERAKSLMAALIEEALGLINSAAAD